MTRGVRCVKQWETSPAERNFISVSEQLAQLVAGEERNLKPLPRQLVHGDFWDNNVLCNNGQVVLVADLDFMGERARIDDLALTLYYTNSTFRDDPLSDTRMLKLRRLVATYEAGLDHPLTRSERLALPLAVARVTLAFVAMIPAVDTKDGARRLVDEMLPDIVWALAMIRNLGRWQTGFV